MNAETPPFLHLQGLTKRFGRTLIFQDVDLGVDQGSLVSIIGPSGAGKTTLLHIIAGLEPPTAGLVRLSNNGSRPTAILVFQDYVLFPTMTVRDNVAFGLRARKLPKTLIRDKVQAMLGHFHLEDRAEAYPAQLSGGQKQRVAIARALINEPSVLLLDEPLSALDAKLRQHMLIELDAIHDKIGITFIYVTHDQQEALSVSDRIAVMNAGKVLQVGTPQEIYEAPATDFVAKFIGETNLYEGSILSVNGELVTIESAEFGSVQVTDTDPPPSGTRVSWTVRPEKIRIGPDKPSTSRNALNLIQGRVDEPIYSGFQTKFYVKTAGGATLKVIKQHADWSDEGPEIAWKDEVWLSFSAEDAFLVEVKG